MAGLVLSFADLARAARQPAAGPLALPAAAPLDAPTGRELVQILVSDVKRRFSTGTAPDGTPWRPLRYGRAFRGGGTAQPLRDTGALMASFTGRFTGDEVVVGTNHPGAALHNFGGTVVPRRGKFLAIALTAAAKRAGSPRNLRGTAREPLFARRVNGRLVGHFLLVRKAVVPRREFLGVSEPGATAAAAALAESAARRWLQT
ncbi:Phage virion morphogenesis family protein [Gemmata obscuriglobus]|uniref:Virion morphogenesis protein n=1 Tax=Gemmata obscuriglobus TaxID=114 RepID=A0A2Z3GV12_9BACT|nr:phage virion morphogenesis protein [Gemmata obscuriglobus]AWM35902.1 virion morphogenesis protein [Gemmata obscuriglobus]QEG31544.1 Phage virion morphogenesis family protein [Gemmata obscuriglobus]VTS10886.1 Uncharacterized protein OS=Spirochaeta coccoides (strain ATCC BAA-1237 / DSM 17374 / SPN1) GN=Spico_0811 PE=4 SV=1: Phage_tail_S [Gemmata obscuriglobus UQM 2246]